MLTYEELNKIRDENYELWQFLGCYFNQDMESFQLSLDEYLVDSNIESRKKVISSIENFLLTDLYNLEMKAEYIQKEVGLILPQPPLDWLKSIKSQLEKSLTEN